MSGSNPFPSFATSLPTVTLKPGWLIALGVVLLLLGMLALGEAWLLTLTSVLAIGMLLVIAGIVQLAQSFAHSSASTGNRWLAALGGVLYIAAGLLLINEPVTGSIFLTAFVAGLLIISGVARAIWAFGHRYLATWWLALLSGVVSVVLGVLIYAMLPWSGLWLIGTFIGVELIFAGVTMLSLGFTAQRALGS